MCIRDRIWSSYGYLARKWKWLKSKVFFIEISKELPEASTHTINNFNKQKMRIRLNQNQMDYLYDNFIKSNTNLMLKLRIDKKENVYLIEVNDDIADQIRDWANLQLQRKGFDRHYKLTKESKILDMLIDAFYPVSYTHLDVYKRQV